MKKIIGLLVCLSLCSPLLNAEGTSTSKTKVGIESMKFKTGEEFLAANKNQPGIKTTASGLQYKIITAGNGEQPSLTDSVTVDYAGKLIDGTEFDSSYKHGQPITFPVNGVIAGWTEALQLMKAGSTWELYIPAELAYGSTGMPPVIAPNQALIFTVKLISVKKAS